MRGIATAKESSATNGNGNDERRTDSQWQSYAHLRKVPRWHRVSQLGTAKEWLSSSRQRKEWLSSSKQREEYTKRRNEDDLKERMVRRIAADVEAGGAGVWRPVFDGGFFLLARVCPPA